MDQNKTCTYIIFLIRSLLKDTQPPEKPEDISFEDIYRMAEKHHVRNMCFYAIEKLAEKPEQKLYEKWKQYVYVSEVQSAVQLSERDSVISALQRAGIDCLPLKGFFLKEMYPRPEYREMADLDILIRPETEKAVEQVMAANGYIIKKNNEQSAHCVYSKPPFMTVEMHRRLFIDDFFEDHKLQRDSLPMVSDPWNTALLSERPFVYSFSPEDNYIFLILHLAKHYYNSGIGLRQFVDIWLFNQKYKIDKTYVYNKLSGTKMKEFCINTEKLIDIWFNGGEMLPELTEMEEFIFSSGVYGNMNHKISNRIKMYQGDDPKSHLMARYALYRMFPPLSFMKKYYPYVRKHELLLPAAWIHRLVIKVFGKNSPAIRELRVFLKLRNKQDK